MAATELIAAFLDFACWDHGVRYSGAAGAPVLDDYDSFEAACFQLGRGAITALVETHAGDLPSKRAMFTAARRGLSGAEVDPRDADYRGTPMGFAVYSGKALPIIDLFLAHGADPSLGAKESGTAADQTCKRGMVDAARRLESRVYGFKQGGLSMSQRLLRLAIAACFLTGAIHAAEEDRAADRAAIRAHIDRIFQAFIHRDSAELRATHARNWLGYLEGSREMIRGVDGYMDASSYFDPQGRYGMTGYKMREFDMIFQGDAAFVAFVAEVEAKTPAGPFRRTLRITDFYTKQNGGWIQTGSDTDLHPESVESQNQTPRTLPEADKKKLLEAREAVWRAYFKGDRAALEKLLPEELVTIEAAGDWGNREAVLAGSAAFAAGGGKLVRLEFPKTEIQAYGYTAIVYSNYLYELEQGGRKQTASGRVTEVFVYRNGAWVNPGWHMDAR